MSSKLHQACGLLTTADVECSSRRVLHASQARQTAGGSGRERTELVGAVHYTSCRSLDEIATLAERVADMFASDETGGRTGRTEAKPLRHVRRPEEIRKNPEVGGQLIHHVRVPSARVMDFTGGVEEPHQVAGSHPDAPALVERVDGD